MSNNRVLYASAVWCGPCQQFKPVAQKVCSDLGMQLQIVDVDQNAEFTQKYQIRSVPTLIVVDAANNELYRMQGATTKPNLQSILSQYKG